MESQPATDAPAPASKSLLAKSERFLCPYLPQSEPPSIPRNRTQSGVPFVILTGNPNSGKTTVFNALTGLRARVGNYPGVTVERKEGRLTGAPENLPITILDLPGTYSLSPQSPDEQISCDVLFHRLPDVPPPELVVVVVDASNLERNLYYASQVIELGYRTFVALNMIDVAEKNGQHLDGSKLANLLGVPVFPLAASRGQGIEALRTALIDALRGKPRKIKPRVFYELPRAMAAELEPLAELFTANSPQRHTSAHAEALLALTNDKLNLHYPPAVREVLPAARKRLEQAQIDWRGSAIVARYARVTAIRQAVMTEPGVPFVSATDKVDRYVTHKFWGLLFFVLVMGTMFMAIFTLAKIPMNALQTLISWIGDLAASAIPPGEFQNLVVRGIIQGVGAVVVFLPQICLLFLFIGLLEDTGYMSRAAFLMDRLMSKVGLHGRSFIPMLSSFACAIPGIMATRTIDSYKDRLVTILVAPLMSCSARLPVYILLIAACFPSRPWTASLMMLSMYLLGIVAALAMASVFKKTLLKSETPILVMELPPYKRPMAGVILRHVIDPAKLFLYRAGTVILGINILLWFLTAYPKPPETVLRQYAGQRAAILTSAAGPKQELSPDQQDKLAGIDAAEAGERLERSFAGMFGRLLVPAIAPLGFDWKIGIGLVSSFAAREMFVSTMAVVYNVSSGTAQTRQLADVMREQKRSDGTMVYTTLTTITLMVFYALALQCVSTIAVVRRETNSWKWPVFQWVYMGVMAWVVSFVIYHGGRMMGLS